MKNISMKEINHTARNMNHQAAMKEIDRFITETGVEAFYEELMNGFYPHIYAHLIEEEA